MVYQGLNLMYIVGGSIIGFLVYFRNDLGDDFWEQFWDYIGVVLIWGLDIFDNLSIIIIIFVWVFQYIRQHLNDRRDRNAQNQ